MEGGIWGKIAILLTIWVFYQEKDEQKNNNSKNKNKKQNKTQTNNKLLVHLQILEDRGKEININLP